MNPWLRYWLVSGLQLTLVLQNRGVKLQCLPSDLDLRQPPLPGLHRSPPSPLTHPFYLYFPSLSSNFSFIQAPLNPPTLSHISTSSTKCIFINWRSKNTKILTNKSQVLFHVKFKSIKNKIYFHNGPTVYLINKYKI